MPGRILILGARHGGAPVFGLPKVMGSDTLSNIGAVSEKPIE
jgi:hypothetical protein